MRSSGHAAPLHIVGIGLSAGGLAPLELLFDAMSEDVRGAMAFLLVQHLVRGQNSMLPALLQRHTGMPVREAVQGDVVEVGHVYVIPPDRQLGIEQDTLYLTDPPASGPRAPIDFLFFCMARELGARAIGILLSGAGNDGSRGARAIKEVGGVVMVQSPASARYGDMPRSAIEACVVDHVLHPLELARRLEGLSRLSLPFSRPSIQAPPPSSPDELREIVDLVRAQTGHDFARYKPSILARRVAQRMKAQGLSETRAYVRYLARSPREVDALSRELLVGVTCFFRDPLSFGTLAGRVLPQLLNAQPEGGTLRVWVIGCASGEEVYSFAMMLHECMALRSRNLRLRIFGTDVDPRAIRQARQGVYPWSIEADVSPERLERFFDREADHYRVKPFLRESVLFARHDLTNDPPYSKLDLISCRNVLIYMDGALQQQLLAVLHRALKDHGVLFLGSSEVANGGPPLFAPLDLRANLYSASPVSRFRPARDTEREIAREPTRDEQPLPKSHEALQRAVVDLHGVTEELRQRNAELQAKRQELQAQNEELLLLNAELRARLADVEFDRAQGASNESESRSSLDAMPWNYLHARDPSGAEAPSQTALPADRERDRHAT